MNQPISKECQHISAHSSAFFQNHERVTISPIFLILVVHVLLSCQDMGLQNRRNRDPLMVLALHPKKTLRRSLCAYFPWEWSAKTPISAIFAILVVHVLTGWMDIGHQNRGNGEIGTLSWFWHFTLRCNRGNRDHHMVLAFHPGKTLRGSLFHLFWWPMSWQDGKTWTTKIGEIGEIGTLSWFWRFTLRGNRGNRDPLMVSCCILTDYGNYSRDLCL